jgi:predicted enzyme related to lactoylglutathione lyase
MQFAGVELYFEDLERARGFYVDTLGLTISDEQAGHHVKFDSAAGFICLEQKGAESYPSRDKAVLFFEVADLPATLRAIGGDKLVQSKSNWAVLHDPEGHNILLLQK